MALGRRFVVAIALLVLACACVPQPELPASRPGDPLPGGGGYPRVIRLQHAGPRTGNLVASVTVSGTTQRFLESDDEGATFSIVGEVVRPDAFSINGTGLVELPDGTLLASLAVRLSGELDAGGSTVDQRALHMDDAVYRSTDAGRTWSQISSCIRTDGPGAFGGIWEPDLHVDDAGLLHCVWSDETDQPAHSQTLRQATSADGGRTWGPPQDVVRSSWLFDRPGMATTTRLGDGTWMMSYEVCGVPRACVVHVRRSLDGGRTWGDPADLGTPVTTTSGDVLLAAPVIAWSPAGGPDGTVIITSNLSVGPFSSARPSASTMAASTDRGATWTLVPSPIAPGQSDGCRRFSTPVFPLDGSGRLLEIEVGLDAAGVCGTRYGTGSLSGVAAP